MVESGIRKSWNLFGKKESFAAVAQVEDFLEVPMNPRIEIRKEEGLCAFRDFEFKLLFLFLLYARARAAISACSVHEV